MRIKNWKKFQHFKDRTPPWIKLYRELLDDPDWHDLDDEASKTLVMLWLIASEDDEHSGQLPSVRKLAFRMRTKENKLLEVCSRLYHWLEQDDINLVSDCHQDDSPETETETDISSFEIFWDAYGKKKGKAASIAQWKKINPDDDLAKAIIQSAKDVAESTEVKFRKDPERWLKGRHWEDEIVNLPKAKKPYSEMTLQEKFMEAL